MSSRRTKTIQREARRSPAMDERLLAHRKAQALAIARSSAMWARHCLEIGKADMSRRWIDESEAWMALYERACRLELSAGQSDRSDNDKE